MGASGKPWVLVWQLILLSSCTNFRPICSAVAIINVNAPDLTLRLTVSPTASVGLLEIEYYKIYPSSEYKLIGTICNYNFHIEEATVACRQLGYRYAKKSTTTESTSDWYSIILQEVNCNGNEDKLVDCYYVLNEGVSNCTHSNDVAIACTNEKPPETPPDIRPGDIRLVGGPNPYEGRLEVLLAETEEWATFCSSHWDFRKAELACEELGYRPATSTGTSRYESGTGPIAHCPSTDNNFKTTECQIFSGTDPASSHDNDVYVVCDGSEPGRQGEVRLVDGSTTTEGRVEFFDQNTWKALCSNDWGIEEVQATCRQLGLPLPSSAVPSGGSFGGNEAGAILQNSITCTGLELTLQSCTWTPRSCRTGDASARCGIISVDKEAQEFDLRLEDGLSRLEGSLRIFYQGEWGPVCASNFGMEEVAVACRQMGFQSANRRKSFGRYRNYRNCYLYMVNCNGNEMNMVDCYHVLDEWAYDARPEVGLVCSNLPAASVRPNPFIGDLRLAGGPNLYEGRVEVYVSETVGWATVCQENVDFSWAEQACRKLKYRPATSVGSGRYDVGSGSIARCPSLTDRLDTHNCQVISDSDPTCSHATDVDIVCSGVDKGRQGQVRLVDGSEETEGRAEFFDQNTWKTLCSDDWGIEEVQATCRQLGLPQPSSAVPSGGSFGRNKAGAILQNSITCTGLERTLQNCSWTPRSTPCTTGDASAQCGMRQAGEESDLRLVDGSVITEGRVEILYQGEWGTICLTNAKDSEATFICNQLGYQYAEGLTYFGPGSGKTLVQNLNCNGNEASILECYHKFDNPGCGHILDLGVICSNLPPLMEEALTIGDLRLAGGPNLYEGRVEIYVSETVGWATVCQDNVDFSWAEQACRKMEYRPATFVGTMRYATGKGPIVICPTENGLLDTENCQLVNQTDPTVSCNHTKDTEIVCDGIEVGNYGDIRLQNGTERTEGSVEIFYENVWQRICADGWGIEEAKTACYQLSMPIPNNTVPGGTFGGNKNKDFISQNIQCPPRQERHRRLDLCKLTPRDTPCSTGDAGLQCGVWEDAKEGDFRLSGGPEISKGLVEVFHGGQWGLICQGDSFNKEDTVACHQFGFLSYKEYPVGLSYNFPLLPVVLRLRECNGKEESLLDCENEFAADSSPCYGRSCCTFFLKVYCDPRPKTETLDVRLVNGPYPNQGIVQVLYDGLEGAICHWDWGKSEAEVVCRQLGYEYAVVDLQGWDVKELYGHVVEYFKIHELECDGSEGNLAKCYWMLPGNEICSGYSGSQAGVVCYSEEYPSVDPRPIDVEYNPAALRRRNAIIIGVCVAAAVLLLLCCACYRLNRKSSPPVTQMSAGSGSQYQPVNNQVTDDPPPQYKDVTNSPDSYPVVSSGPDKVGQTAV